MLTRHFSYGGGISSVDVVLCIVNIVYDSSDNEEGGGSLSAVRFVFRPAKGLSYASQKNFNY